ncbi:MAG: hypothetical protein AB7P12_18630 [Alphaproteobacteria bacterium]
MSRFPAEFPGEFEDLLSRDGRRVLAGTAPCCGALADPRRRFVALPGLIPAAKADALRRLLDRRLYDALTTMEAPIPPEATWEMTEDYGELLPKTVRVKTAYLERRRTRAYEIAEEIGLVAMLRSASFHAFVEAVAGKELKRRDGVQALCYGAGDYAGPHNDHHPEQPAARGGYVDCHISLASPAVEHQWLVYAERGHLSRMESVATRGGITVYRLPFWHFTTPLAARPGREAAARRWVLLGTFLYKQPRQTPARKAGDIGADERGSKPGDSPGHDERSDRPSKGNHRKCGRREPADR